jgi:hypothetical protein
MKKIFFNSFNDYKNYCIENKDKIDFHSYDRKSGIAKIWFKGE